jgi:hypothetical protein
VMPSAPSVAPIRSTLRRLTLDLSIMALTCLTPDVGVVRPIVHWRARIGKPWNNPATGKGKGQPATASPAEECS